jgi:hypothetical protein
MAHRPPVRAAVLAVLVLSVACARVRPAPAQPAGAGPQGWTVRAFVVRSGGRLVLALPPGWTASEGEEGDGAAPSIRLRKPGARFLVLLAPIAFPGEDESPHSRGDAAQLFAELGRRSALAGSVEREIPLEELVGPGVRGAYFSATDRDLVGREPGPDEYRHVLQGAAAVGPVILAFTLLDDGPGPWRAEVLELVRTARHVPDGAEGDDGDAALEPLPGVETAPLRVALPGRTWAVLVDLPGFAVARVAARAVVPGAVHVLARSPETDVIASVLLAPAGEAKDAAACRARAIARVRAAVPAIEDLRVADGGGAAAATYTIAGGSAGAPEWHAHAFLWRDGVCASLHVSKGAPDPEDAARLDAVLSSFRIAEDL